MAILKLFGSSSSRSPSPAALPALRITHHVPAFGGIYLPPPSLPVTEHIPEIIYGGRLEVFLPPGSGRSRCKSIKIGFRTTSTLDLGPKRGKEEDVVFERSIVLDEGTILEEGSQLYVSSSARNGTQCSLLASSGTSVFLEAWRLTIGIPRAKSSTPFLPKSKERHREAGVVRRHLAERSRLRPRSRQLDRGPALPAHSVRQPSKNRQSTRTIGHLSGNQIARRFPGSRAVMRGSDR